MDRELLARADRMVAALSPARRETVREIVVNAIHRGSVDPSAKRYLDTVSGGEDLSDILTRALDDGRPAGGMLPATR